jgi:hypothetical protein
MRAAYHTAHATTNSDITHTQTGIDDRASARWLHRTRRLWGAGPAAGVLVAVPAPVVLPGVVAPPKRDRLL